MAAGLKAQSIKSVVWATGDSVGVALLSFASFVVLARVLEPQDFGVVALASVFVFFFTLLTGHSFSDVIVQRLHVDPEHLDTAFWSTLGLAVVLMGICLAAADFVAQALGEPRLAPVLRWLSAILPLQAGAAVQMALMRRAMRFDSVAKRSVVARAMGAIVAVTMALTGWGMWSLVGQQITGALIVAFAFAVTPWRPRFRFSFARLKEMWGFGMKVSLAQVVSGANEQIINLLIGIIFGATVLGYFTVAWRMVLLLRALIYSAVYHVGLSAFAKMQDDRAAVASAFLQSTRIACLVGFPIAVGMSLTARPFIDALFGDKWDASISLVAILALEMIPTFYGIFATPLYRALNKPGWVLWMALLSLAVGVISVLTGSMIGVTLVAALWVVRAALLVPVHMVLMHNLLGVSIAMLVRPMIAPLGAGAIMGTAVAALRAALAAQGIAEFVQLAVIVPIGAIVYGGSVWLLAPGLFETAIRTAAVVLSPLKRRPVLVSKGVES